MLYRFAKDLVAMLGLVVVARAIDPVVVTGNNSRLVYSHNGSSMDWSAYSNAMSRESLTTAFESWDCSNGSTSYQIYRMGLYTGGDSASLTFEGTAITATLLSSYYNVYMTITLDGSPVGHINTMRGGPGSIDEGCTRLDSAFNGLNDGNHTITLSADVQQGRDGGPFYVPFFQSFEYTPSVSVPTTLTAVSPKRSKIPITVGATIAGFLLLCLVGFFVVYLRRRQSSRRTHQSGLNSVDGTIPIIEEAITSVDRKIPATESIQLNPSTKLSDQAQQSVAASSDETSGVIQRIPSETIPKVTLAKSTKPLDANRGTKSFTGSQPSGSAVTDVPLHAQLTGNNPGRPLPSAPPNASATTSSISDSTLAARILDPAISDSVGNSSLTPTQLEMIALLLRRGVGGEEITAVINSMTSSSSGSGVPNSDLPPVYDFVQSK